MLQSRRTTTKQVSQDNINRVACTKRWCTRYLQLLAINSQLNPVTIPSSTTMSFTWIGFGFHSFNDFLPRPFFYYIWVSTILCKSTSNHSTGMLSMPDTGMTSRDHNKSRTLVIDTHPVAIWRGISLIFKGRCHLVLFCCWLILLLPQLLWPRWMHFIIITMHLAMLIHYVRISELSPPHFSQTVAPWLS